MGVSILSVFLVGGCCFTADLACSFIFQWFTVLQTSTVYLHLPSPNCPLEEVLSQYTLERVSFTNGLSVITI